MSNPTSKQKSRDSEGRAVNDKGVAFADVLAAASRGEQLDPIDVLGAQSWRIDNQCREIASLRKQLAAARSSVETPAGGPYTVQFDLMDRIYETLKFYANRTNYEGERIGGVVQGCPRGPIPTSDQLIGYAQRTLSRIDKELLRRESSWESAEETEEYLGPIGHLRKLGWEYRSDSDSLVRLPENGEGKS